MERLEKAVRSFLKEETITSVSAKDPARIEKVVKARNSKYQILFTTTILERGVTFENVSVVVMGADHPVFLNQHWSRLLDELIEKVHSIMEKFSFSMIKQHQRFVRRSWKSKR